MPGSPTGPRPHCSHFCCAASGHWVLDRSSRSRPSQRIGPCRWRPCIVGSLDVLEAYVCPCVSSAKHMGARDGKTYQLTRHTKSKWECAHGIAVQGSDMESRQMTQQSSASATSSSSFTPSPFFSSLAALARRVAVISWRVVCRTWAWMSRASSVASIGFRE